MHQRGTHSLEGGLILRKTATWQEVLRGVLLVWCVIASSAALQSARARQIDPMARLEAEFLPFAPYLPPTSTVGYLEHRNGTDAAIRLYYAAQYALIPRVVVAHVGPELLIVPAGAEQAGDDERLKGYRQVRAFPTGHRLFVRVP
jgi:hypothetical protein